MSGLSTKSGVERHKKPQVCTANCVFSKTVSIMTMTEQMAWSFKKYQYF